MKVARTHLRTSTGRRMTFLGLFATRRIESGEYLGKYTGEIMSERRARNLFSTARAVYAFHNTRDGTYIVPKLGIGDKPDPTVDVFAFMNEASHDASNNVRFEADASIVAIAPIAAGEEILVDYGTHYPRTYTRRGTS